jgi:hypothetical protein
LAEGFSEFPQNKHAPKRAAVSLIVFFPAKGSASMLSWKNTSDSFPKLPKSQRNPKVEQDSP